MHPTIDDLRSHLNSKPVFTPEYTKRMMHPFPEAATVDRKQFVVRRCEGKRVLEFGASGYLHRALLKATTVIGVDRAGEGVIHFDLDDVSLPLLPAVDDIEIVLCGEIIEHLGNPGFFLQRLWQQYPGVPVIVTVPNAFTTVGASHLKKGVENVNEEHVAWYSYHTLKVLVERYRFEIKEFYWYGGDGPTAEGIVMIIQ